MLYYYVDVKMCIYAVLHFNFKEDVVQIGEGTDECVKAAKLLPFQLKMKNLEV